MSRHLRDTVPFVSFLTNQKSVHMPHGLDHRSPGSLCWLDCEKYNTMICGVFHV